MPGKGERFLMTKIYVNQITKDKLVESIFLVNRKELKTTRNGKLYLSIELRDKTGLITGKIWNEAEEVNQIFSEEDFVNVKATVNEYQGRLELNISQIRTVLDEEVDQGEFLPVTKRDIKDLKGYIKYFIDEVYNPFLKGLLKSFFEDPEFIKKFQKAPAAKNLHHAYLGGLLEHTVTVTIICEHIGQQYDDIDKDLLITGALLHDIGKVDELVYEKKIDYTEEGKFLGHLLIGDSLLINKISNVKNFPKEYELKIRHCLLSHHGELEWGSPKKPSLLEAIILHHVDNLDAKVMGFKEIISKYKDSEIQWTDLKNLFRRPLYIPKAIDEEDVIAEEKVDYE